jgi:hypothetical protein
LLQQFCRICCFVAVRLTCACCVEALLLSVHATAHVLHMAGRAH